jgi:hypothetical protein
MPSCWNNSMKPSWKDLYTSSTGLPSLSALMVTGVPCESVPVIISTLLPFEAVVAGENVTGQVGTRDIAHMNLGIGIGPGDCN